MTAQNSIDNAILIAIIGGTGELGSAIARRLVKAGERVIIGSRDAARAASCASALAAELAVAAGKVTGTRDISGTSNVEAAARADLIIVTVPFGSQEATLKDIAAGATGKIVVDTTVPLVPPKVMRVQLPPEGSAAVRAQKILGEGVRVVSAFHNVAAHKLATDAAVECDVLVFGDDKAAREAVIRVVAACGLRGLHAGALANSAAAEALTSILIFLNKHYAVDGAGVRITGNLKSPAAG
ncbi:MAG: NADPH-dependent F420 reductase [Gammaproteobacteria bacterium]|nr:NADPH-dependent F420 reductase [Gammaproteobacteria bacterium]